MNTTDHDTITLLICIACLLAAIAVLLSTEK